jgi:hypothetical protein
VTALLYQQLDENAIPRDRWGRPLLDIDGTLVPFTRCSTVAKALDDQSNLLGWRSKTALLGAAQRPELIAAAYAARSNKKALGKIADLAHEAGGGDQGSVWGTAIHALVSEVVTTGLAPSEIPDELARRDTEAVIAALAGYEVLASEVFVADVDRLVAGTADLVLRVNGRSFVADLKTSGSSGDYLLGATSIQLASYALSRPYTPEHGFEDWPHDFDPTIGLLIHCPYQTGTVRTAWLNLVAGADGLDLALHVRKWRQSHKPRVSTVMVL